jgi:hypothetical protein
VAGGSARAPFTDQPEARPVGEDFILNVTDRR